MNTNHPGEPHKETVSQGGGGRVQNLPAPAANEQTIKEFIPASWFHPVGIFKVLIRFWNQLPDVNGKLFLTFTLDPKNYASEEAAFEDSRDWLRKVFYQLRQGVKHKGKIYTIDAPYCIKVEFHESGWVHYHAIFLTRRFLPKELLAALAVFEEYPDLKDGKVKLDGDNVVEFHKLPEMQQVTLKVLRWEERDKRLIIKEAQMVA